MHPVTFFSFDDAMGLNLLLVSNLVYLERSKETFLPKSEHLVYRIMYVRKVSLRESKTTIANFAVIGLRKPCIVFINYLSCATWGLAVIKGLWIEISNIQICNCSAKIK